MSKYKLIINPFAEQDIIDAKNWYNEQKENLGSELIQEIKKTVGSIVANPLQFPEVKKEIRSASVNRFPYSIFYTITAQVINVFALFHTSRNPRIWKKRGDQKS